MINTMCKRRDKKLTSAFKIKQSGFICICMHIKMRKIHYKYLLNDNLLLKIGDTDKPMLNLFITESGVIRISRAFWLITATVLKWGLSSLYIGCAVDKHLKQATIKGSGKAWVYK